MRAPELADMRYEIEDAFPGAEFKKETEISIGPVLMALIRTGARVAPGSDEWRPFLKGARRVQVAVYEAQSLPDQPHRNMNIPDRLSDMLVYEGWELMIKAYEPQEVTWVLYRLEEDEVRNLYVISLDHEELVLVNLEGDITKMIVSGLEDRVFWEQ